MATIFEKYEKGLEKTRKGVFAAFIQKIKGPGLPDEIFFQEVEELLLEADLGFRTVAQVIETARQTLRSGQTPEEAFHHALLGLLSTDGRHLNLKGEGLPVLLFVGVNGVGKTTTVAKVALRLKEEGMRPLIVAGDTFRAAGSAQMQVWGAKIGVDVVAKSPGHDPAALVYEAIDTADQNFYDALLIDTAGRMHTKKGLMDEIGKIKRIIEKKSGAKPAETLLVVDATTGQNALRQAEIFHDALGLTGLILTKVDGSSKGGIVFSLESLYNVPVKLIGMGEGVHHLEMFDPRKFVEALFS